MAKLILSVDGTVLKEITPGMRYLHSSRTIHQLVTDRNRAVGIYLAVASLLPPFSVKTRREAGS